MAKTPLSLVDAKTPEIRRAECPKCGVLTYTLMMAVAPILNKKGRVDDRCKKIHVCPYCFIRSGDVREVGR